MPLRKRYLQRVRSPFRRQTNYGSHGIRHGDRLQFRMSAQGPLLVGTVRDELGQLERSASVAIALDGGMTCVIDARKSYWAPATPEAEESYAALAAGWKQEEKERYESRPLLGEDERSRARSSVLSVDELQKIVERLIRRYGEADYFENKGAVEMSLIEEIKPLLAQMTLVQIGVLVLDLSERPEMEQASRSIVESLDYRDDFEDIFVDRRLLALY